MLTDFTPLPMVCMDLAITSYLTAVSLKGRKLKFAFYSTKMFFKSNLCVSQRISRLWLGRSLCLRPLVPRDPRVDKQLELVKDWAYIFVWV